MDNIHIPFIPDLDNLDTGEIISRLESDGERHTVESLNWAAEYPYHPLTTFTLAHSEKISTSTSSYGATISAL